MLVKTGHELKDVGTSLTWDALDAFLTYADADSALVRELNPDVSTWASITKTNVILADIYDVLAAINANLMAIGTRRAAKKPKPYPRPTKPNPENERHFGRDPLPPNELRAWFEEKRKQNAGSSKRNP